MNQLPCESCITEAPHVYIAEQEDHFDTKSSNNCPKKCIIYTILFAILIAVIIGSILLVFNQKLIRLNELESGFDDQKRITFDELIKNPLLQPRSFLVSGWLSDSQFLVRNEFNDIIIFSINEGQIEETNPKLFLSRNYLKNEKTIFNSDASLVAFLKPQNSYPMNEFDCEVGRMSDIDGSRHKLRVKNKNITNVQVFLWNPAPNTSDYLFVYNNSLYYQRFGRQESTVKIANSDSPFVLYGVADWMITEEILKQSVWWSKSGRYIAYASYDSRNTSKVMLTYDSKHFNLSYPRPGDEYLHGTWLFIWDKVDQTRQFGLPNDNLMHDSENSIQYLFSAAWTELSPFGEVLISVWANRLQNSVSFTLCPIREKCFQFFKFKYHINGKALWAEPRTLNLKFFTSTGFFIILPRGNKNRNIYDNIAYIEIIQPSPYFASRHKLTIHTFAFDAAEIVGYNTERDELFFTAQNDLIGEMHLFRISAASKSKQTVQPECITCQIKDCNYVRPILSTNSKRMLIECESPYRISQTYLKSTSNIMKSYLIQPNSNQVELSSRKYLPTILFESIRDANIEIILPSNFNKSEKYPVLLSVYSGPNSNSVEKKSPNYIETYLVEAYSLIIVKIDARGSGLRGWNLKHKIYRHLGGPEIEDQLEILRLLLENYSFLDSNRISVSGWSYGGFASLHIAQLDTDGLIKCVIAGGSVVDFHNYDAAYTERYMGFPEDNPVGYSESSLLSPDRLEIFRRIKLLIIHGLSDENVIFDWNSGQLIRQLQQYNHNFTQILYPNERHAFSQGRRHFISELERFLASNCLN